MTDSSAPIASTLTPMQQALLDRADSIFSSIGSTVSKASDLAMQGGKAVAAQIPDIAYQYVAYGRAIETTFIVLSVLFTILGSWLIVHNANNKFGYNENNDGGTIAWIITLLGGIVTVVASVITFFSQLSDFIMVWFAPKVWLLLQITQLVKSLHGQGN